MLTYASRRLQGHFLPAIKQTTLRLLYALSNLDDKTEFLNIQLKLIIYIKVQLVQISGGVYEVNIPLEPGLERWTVVQ